MADRESMLAKVRALLAKAEHPNTPEPEAEALTAKAAELMARYGIDEALAAAREDRRELPQRKVILIDDPYASAKATLLYAIAAASRCHAVQLAGRPVRSYVYGFKADLEATEILYTTLLLQMANGVTRARSVDARGRNRTRSARYAYILGFTAAVSARLRAAHQKAEEESAAPGTALVLASRDLAVTNMYREAHPTAKKRSVAASNRQGFGSGYAAGQRADIGGTRIGRGTGRALSR